MAVTDSLGRPPRGRLRGAFTLKRLGAILGIVAACLTVLSTIVTTGLWVYECATQTPKIVIHELQPIPGRSAITIKFSVANRSDSPLYLTVSTSSSVSPRPRE